MSMRFNRFYNKLSKKNSKINLASYDDKLISSVPAEELDLPNGYTISDNKVFYNDTEIGKFSYRNINSSSVSDDIDLDDIDIISNKEDSLDIDLDNINIPDKEDSLDIDLDNINIPDKEDPLDIDLDNNNIPDKEDSLDVDLDNINIIPSKATKVPKTTIDDTKLANEGHVFPSYEIKEEFTTQEQQELLEKIHDVQEDLRKSFLEYESNKKDLTEDYVKQIEGYKTRFNDLQQEIVFESKKETIEQLNELNLMKKQVDNVNGRIRFKLNNVNNDAKKDSKKTISALDRIKSVKKEDKEQEEEKRIELIKEYAGLFDKNQKLVLVCRELYDYLVESGEDKEYDSLKRSYFVLPNLLDSISSVEDIESKIKDAKYHNERLCEMIDNAKAKQEAEKSNKTENEEVKAKKALIAKSLLKDMKDIITKEAKVVGMRALAFTLKQVADIKKAAEEKVVEIKTSVPEKKYSTALDKIRAKKEQEDVKQEASDIVKELKEKTEEPKMVVPEFLRITKKEEKVEKVEPEVKPEPVVVEETITTKTDVDFETLDERIYNKYSVKDIKELDEKYTEKIEKFNSKLDKTNNKIEKTDKKIVEKEVALALAIESSNLENELIYREELQSLKEKLEELKNKAEKLKGKISDKEATINSIKERFTAESIKVYEENEAKELRIMQEKEDAMNARLEEEAILERDKNRKEISKVFRQDVAKEESALNFKTNNEIKKLLAYTKKLEAEGKDSKEFIKNYAAAIEAERKANENLKEFELAMGIVKDNKKTAKRK